MHTIVSLVRILVSTLQALIVLALIYYYGLLLAGAVRPKSRRHTGLAAREGRRPRFAVVIPAHNEASVLSRTLEQLRQQTYPLSLYDIYVIADHCDDETAQVAFAGGATALERSVEPRGRKAYALQWGLEDLLSGTQRHDAFVIFDADSLVDPGCLTAMARAFDDDHQVLQGQHIILRPEHRRFSGSATVDMRLNNLLRNQAKTNLGLSCRLMGDAMCLSSDIIARYGWISDSLTEDRQYGVFLVSQGLRCTYVPEAISRGQAAPSWQSAAQQRLRWYGGVAEIQRQLAGRMLRYAIHHRSAVALDQAVELLVPPLSSLGAFSAGLLVVQLLWLRSGVLVPWPAWTGVVVLWLTLPFWGLLAARAPREEIRALLYLPPYIVWRIWIGVRARLLGRRVRWVRTERREER